ncbi:MAG: lytic transglycosylase domain-containing protein [Steroidobacteraceae bacterium]
MFERTLLAGSLVAFSLALTPAQADIYSFTDELGVTHFTNVPADARYQVLLRSAPETSQAGARISPAMLARSAEYDNIIEAAAAQATVEPSLLRAVIVVESAFDPDAVSSKGARGLMQLMPATAKAYGAVDVDDPAQNVQAGARYLRDLLKRYENDLELVLAAYNAGEAAVEQHGRRIPPFAETRRYVPRVLRVYNSLRELAVNT